MFLSKNATLVAPLKEWFGKQQKKQQWFSSDESRYVGNRPSQKKTVKGCKK